VKEKNKAALARALGISRRSLYYVRTKDARDWELRQRIEEVLSEHPAYGSRRIAQALRMNRKRIARVMKKYGILPYRRRRTKRRKPKKIEVTYPNLLRVTTPQYPHRIWAADFTELSWRNKKVYVATVIDVYTREVVGVAVSTRKGAPLTLQALYGALLAHPRPTIFHSDNGREYDARVFTKTLAGLGVLISRSAPGSPWQNGYQESFYGKFKIDLGDPGRFPTLGHLVAEIYRTVWAYNHTRIHSALTMPPRQFAQLHAAATLS
jgi:putative transposase